MNLLTTVIAASIITLSASASASAHQTQKLVSADKSRTTEICMAVASNKPVKLYHTLRNNRLTISKANKAVRCNDMTLAQFGEKYNATKTVAHLQRHQVKSQLYTAL
jgi:hypothetical protein